MNKEKPKNFQRLLTTDRRNSVFRKFYQFFVIKSPSKLSNPLPEEERGFLQRRRNQGFNISDRFEEFWTTNLKFSNPFLFGSSPPFSANSTLFRKRKSRTDVLDQPLVPQTLRGIISTSQGRARRSALAEKHCTRARRSALEVLNMLNDVTVMFTVRFLDFEKNCFNLN